MFAKLFSARRRWPRSRTVSHRQLRCEALETRELLSAISVFSNNTPKPIKDAGSITSTISVPSGYLISTVNLNITHTRDQDLSVALSGPDGTTVVLFNHVGGTGDNFTNTTLDDRVSTRIDQGTAPFTGAFCPTGCLELFRGHRMAGNWKLQVTDNVRGETGILNSWSLTAALASSVSTAFLDTSAGMAGHAANGVSGMDVTTTENGDAVAVWMESQGVRFNGPEMIIASRYDAAAGRWQPPVAVSNAFTYGGLPTDPRIAGDGRGNYLAVWVQHDATLRPSVWTNRYVVGAGWQTAQVLDPYAPGSPSPQVAMAYDASSGETKGVVAWAGRDSGDLPVDVKVNRLLDFAANRWSGATVAEAQAGDLYGLQLGMAASGDFMVSFYQYQADTPADVFARHYQWATGWSGPETAVEDRAESAYSPRLAVNAAGSAVLAWMQRTAAGNATQVWARRWDGAAWSTEPELVSDDAANAARLDAVAISDNGELAVLYNQKRGGAAYYDALVRRHAMDGWQGIAKIDSEDVGDVTRFNAPADLGMDDAGNLIAVWHQSDGEFTNVWQARFDRVISAWSPAAKVEAAPFNAYPTVVAVNGAGVATLVWGQPDTTLYHLYAARTTLGSGAAAALASPAAAATAVPSDSLAAVDLLMSDWDSPTNGKRRQRIS